jgi:hypothetical protein
MILSEEEIVVIELDRIDSVGTRQMTKNLFRSGRSLQFLATARKIHNAAEVAAKWTTNARLMHGGPAP